MKTANNFASKYTAKRYILENTFSVGFRFSIESRMQRHNSKRSCLSRKKWLLSFQFSTNWANPWRLNIMLENL